MLLHRSTCRTAPITTRRVAHIPVCTRYMPRPTSNYLTEMRHTLHDMTQPLTAIMLLAEINLDIRGDDADLEAIHTAALHLRELVGALQDRVHSLQDTTKV